MTDLKSCRRRSLGKNHGARNARIRGARNASGFTLIELLVAITILAVVAVLGWRGLDSIVRARIALTENLDLTRAMQLTFAQMQSDCAQVVSATTPLANPRLVATQNQLTLVRSVNAEGQPNRLQVVTYRLRNGALSRQESLPTRDLSELATAWQAASVVSNATEVSNGSDAANAGNINDALTLQSDVTAITMRLWQAKAWQAPLPQNNNATETVIPEPATGLEVSLQLRGRSTAMRKIFLLGAV